MLRVMGLERKNVESLGFKFAEGLAVMGPKGEERMEDGKESIIEGKRGCFTEGDRRSTVEFFLKIAIYRKLRKPEALEEKAPTVDAHHSFNSGWLEGKRRHGGGRWEVGGSGRERGEKQK